MTVSEISSIIEEFAPLALQESYDNAGLLVGDKSMSVTGVLISIDVTEAVIDEAIKHNCNLIISHHPIRHERLFRTYFLKIITNLVSNLIILFKIPYKF